MIYFEVQIKKAEIKALFLFFFLFTVLKDSLAFLLWVHFEECIEDVCR